MPTPEQLANAHRAHAEDFGLVDREPEVVVPPARGSFKKVAGGIAAAGILTSLTLLSRRGVAEPVAEPDTPEV